MRCALAGMAVGCCTAAAQDQLRAVINVSQHNVQLLPRAAGRSSTRARRWELAKEPKPVERSHIWGCKPNRPADLPWRSQCQRRKRLEFVELLASHQHKESLHNVRVKFVQGCLFVKIQGLLTV